MSFLFTPAFSFIAGRHVVDADFDSVVLLLNGEGTSIEDKSSISTQHTVTAYGPTTSSTQAKFGSKSLAMTNIAGNRIVVSNDNGEFSFGTDSFTIEAWVYLTAMPETNGYSGAAWVVGGGPFNSNAGMDIVIGSTNIIMSIDNFTGIEISVAHGMSTNQWYHVAWVRDGTSLAVYVDGVQKGTATSSATADPCLTGIAIGAAEPSGATDGNFPGFIDDLRITKGVARYSSSFTPPTSALTNTVSSGTVDFRLNGDGTNNQTAFTDQSASPYTITTFGNAHVDTSVKKFGSGSIEFDGNGDYLRTSDFGLTSGDFTIEAWVQLKAMPTSDSWPGAYSSWMIIVGVGTFNASDGWQFRIGQTQLAFGTNLDTTAVTGTHGMSTGTWYHLAVTRSGNVYKLYVDGSSVGSATYTAQQPGSGAYGWIGAETGQGAYLNGYIDDLRITKGAVIYNNNFTPPTSAFPTQ